MFGGSVLFLGFHLRGRALPLFFIAAHGALALTGFILWAAYHFWLHEARLRP